MGRLLEAKNSTKIFSLGGLIRKKHVTAVENFSLEIEEDRQKVVTLAGESGSGKTTITNMLLGFIKVIMIK
jgi:peptide/nickel transport system ATP-binding protein